jgi:hypothetical protein
MRSVRTWAVVSAIAALILLSPILALLAVIAAEVLIDGLMEAGVTGVSAIAIGAIGWVQFRRIWRSEIAPLSGSKEVCEAPPIAAPAGVRRRAGIGKLVGRRPQAAPAG